MPSEAMISEVRKEMNALRGELFSMVEAAGLRQTQEDGMKRLVRHLTYDTQGHLEAALRQNGAK